MEVRYIVSDGDRKEMLSQTGHRKLSSGKVDQSCMVVTNTLIRSQTTKSKTTTTTTTKNTQILMEQKIIVITDGINPYGVPVSV